MVLFLCICQWGGVLSSRGAAHGATRGHLRGPGPLSLRLLEFDSDSPGI